MKALYRLCIISFVLLMASGCAAKFTVKTEPITGKVVDAETNEPIEDVIVIGYWPGYTFYLHTSTAPTIEVLESVTDRDGKYVVPGWLKKNQDATFRHIDPQMIFFKTGYEIEVIRNKYSSKNVGKIPSYFHPWKAEWDRQKIKMKKFNGDNRAYRKYLNEVQFRSPFKNIFKYCKYINVPQLLIAMEDYYQTQPDYWVPGRVLTVGEMVPELEFRATLQSPSAGGLPGPEKVSPEDKPLPSILTITQLESLGSRCEVTPIEYLKRITSNEKDFIHTSNRDITPKN